MPPPDQHIGRFEQSVWHAAFGLVERRGADFEIPGGQRAREVCVNAVGIEVSDEFAGGVLFALVDEFIPEEEPDLFHRTKFLFR